MSSSMRHYPRLPSRIAMLLGLGALSIVGARADTRNEPHRDRTVARVPQHSAKAFSELLIWSDGGRIYVSEAGNPAEELRLGETAEAELLRQMLLREGATAEAPRVLHDRVILVGGGGDGFHWEPPRKDKK